ncbi:NfeD family protein [Amycolatopsis alkalitolerans]|uniref:NfeD-like C-terminal domain-containing protein n=1 Tax=Amycolatopsis alkalitolerans TaxID=2547244 RepID=A0A5C4M136_9PSEU|nr:NfeD family protein [Amycolatopsis alkalitolerans]TNC24581.1 hypothetical protein FG385_17390 [Amycolatopsis alkalitolerans]
MNGDSSVVGRVGELVHATRGPDGPGEVRVRIRGGTEIYLAWSEEPLPPGTAVLVVGSRGARTVDVVPWSDLPGAH